MNRRFSIVAIVFVVGVIMASSCGSTLRASERLSEMPAGDGWMPGWQYRKVHNITGSVAGPQVNYPIRVAVRFESGTDSEERVYLSGKCRSDFSDVRFSDSASSSLDFWIQEKMDSVQALFWVELNVIPEYPGSTAIYIYYGNPNASAASNKDWTLAFASDFEDVTTQGWSASWLAFTTWDNATSSAFDGSYARGAGRLYGSSYYGNGDFFDSFQNSAYLGSGSYAFEGAARFARVDPYMTPVEIRLFVDDVPIEVASNPGTAWHWLSGNFTRAASGYTSLRVEFHLRTQNLVHSEQCYYADSLLVRRLCYPEPAHGEWGMMEVISEDWASPNIVSVVWMPAAPFPFVSSSTPRSGEAVAVWANVTDTGGSGVNAVHLSYRADAGPWCNVSMTWNATSGLWVAAIPGYPGTCSVEFFVTEIDGAGNIAVGEMLDYVVKDLLSGDVDGDGDVDIFDLVKIAADYGQTW
jgi:hypothetical protein